MQIHLNGLKQEEEVFSVKNNHCLAYIGTFAEQSEIVGIAILDVNLDTGELTLAGHSEMIEKPTYLALSADWKHLYATIETDRYEGQPGGGVASFLIGRDGSLSLQSRNPSHGEFPCHISVDHANTVAFASNYGSGTAVAYRLDPDGSLLPEPRMIRHSGSGPDPDRQTRPHVHCSVFSPDERYLCVCDLGLDKVMLYDFSRGKGDMSLVGTLSVSPGDGPRHIVFNNTGDRAYVLSEMGCQVFVFSYDRSDGSFLPLQTIPTLPPGVSGSSCSAIRLTPDGQLLMASNRGHDSITVFRVLPDGQLRVIAHNPTMGQTPRDFNITPNGKFVIVGNQDSNEVKVFPLDAETGLFSFPGCSLEIPGPVCVLFYQPDHESADEATEPADEHADEAADSDDESADEASDADMAEPPERTVDFSDTLSMLDSILEIIIRNVPREEYAIKGGYALRKISEKARYTRDIDLSIPTREAFQSLMKAFQIAGEKFVGLGAHSYRIREIEIGMSGGLEIYKDQHKILVEADVSVQDLSFGIQVSDSKFRSYSLERMLCDKVRATLSQKRYRRVKDLYDIYLMVSNFRIDLDILKDYLKRQGAVLTAENTPFTEESLLKWGHAWDKFRLLPSSETAFQEKPTFDRVLAVYGELMSRVYA